MYKIQLWCVYCIPFAILPKYTIKTEVWFMSKQTDTLTVWFVSRLFTTCPIRAMWRLCVPWHQLVLYWLWESVNISLGWEKYFSQQHIFVKQHLHKNNSFQGWMKQSFINANHLLRHFKMALICSTWSMGVFGNMDGYGWMESVPLSPCKKQKKSLSSSFICRAFKEFQSRNKIVWVLLLRALMICLV